MMADYKIQKIYAFRSIYKSIEGKNVSQAGLVSL